MKLLFKHRLAPEGHAWSRHPLARKLALVSALKLLVLMALWWAFFSGNGPRGGGEGMTPEQAADAILHSKITGTNEIINATQ